MQRETAGQDHSGNRKKRAGKNKIRLQRKQNRLSMILVSVVVVLIMVAVVVGSIDVRNKIREKSLTEHQIDTQIRNEENRALEIDQLEKEVQTKGWIENEAREKLGLVYEDEIMFKQE